MRIFSNHLYGYNNMAFESKLRLRKTPNLINEIIPKESLFNKEIRSAEDLSKLSNLLYFPKKMKATAKLKSVGFTRDIESFKIQRLVKSAKENFVNVLDALIKMHEEVERGQEVTENYVLQKLGEIIKKFNLSENSISQIKNILSNEWKYSMDYLISQGISKEDIPREIVQQKIYPNLELISRFDILFSKAGKPIENKLLRSGLERRKYKNEFDDVITLYRKNGYDVSEKLVIKLNGEKRTITKQYLTKKKHLYKNIEGMNKFFYKKNDRENIKFVECIEKKNHTTEITYDDWGIKIKELHIEDMNNFKVIDTIYYYGDETIKKKERIIKEC